LRQNKQEVGIESLGVQYGSMMRFRCKVCFCGIVD